MSREKKDTKERVGGDKDIIKRKHNAGNKPQERKRKKKKNRKEENDQEMRRDQTLPDHEDRGCRI